MNGHVCAQTDMRQNWTLYPITLPMQRFDITDRELSFEVQQELVPFYFKFCLYAASYETLRDSLDYKTDSLPLEYHDFPLDSVHTQDHTLTY